jgi:CrcB protein
LTLFLLASGGALGALARYRLGAFILRKKKHTFPLGTFLINVSGALLLGIICGMGVGGNPYVLFGDGFCGAFTTFSTFTVESVQLVHEHAKKKAAAFILLSCSAGMACFSAGYFAADFLKLIAFSY